MRYEQELLVCSLRHLPAGDGMHLWLLCRVGWGSCVHIRDDQFLVLVPVLSTTNPQSTIKHLVQPGRHLPCA